MRSENSAKCSPVVGHFLSRNIFYPPWKRDYSYKCPLELHERAVLESETLPWILRNFVTLCYLLGVAFLTAVLLSSFLFSHFVGPFLSPHCFADRQYFPFGLHPLFTEVKIKVAIPCIPVPPSLKQRQMLLLTCSSHRFTTTAVIESCDARGRSWVPNAQQRHTEAVADAACFCSTA